MKDEFETGREGKWFVQFGVEFMVFVLFVYLCFVLLMNDT